MTRMTRWAVVCCFAVASAAVAQVTPTTDAAAPVDAPVAAPAEAPATTPSLDALPPPPPPPPSDITAATPAPEPTLGDRLVKKKRFSRFSAGPGGPLVAFTELLAGLIGGGIVGGAMLANTGNATSGIYVGAVVGGLGLGGLGIAVQYMHPFGLGSAGAIALATGVGGLAGAGFADILRGDPTTFGWSLLLGSQLGFLAGILATWSSEDINAEDLSLMGMTSLYAFVLTGLVTMAVAGGGAQIPAWPLLMSPALGMGLGALWATGEDMAPGRILKLTALPLGVGLALFYLGSLLLVNQSGLQLMAITTLAGVVATFGLTYVFTMEEEPAPGTARRKPGSTTVIPTVAVMPAGRRNEALAAGPALLVTF